MNNLEKNEIDIIKEIQNGKYREYYLIYNRKSTDEPDNQKNSIKYQKSENSRFAFRERISIAPFTLQGFCADGVISEKHSGFKEDFNLDFNEDGSVRYNIDRPKFYRLLSFLNKGLFKGVVVLCWDRLSRNKGDDTIVRKLMRKGVDIRFALAKYDKTSSGALHMDIDGMFAEHHSRVTSEKVSLNIKNQREKGICTYRAPVGYLNLGTMEHKPFDPERAPLIKQFFELYSTGEWTLADLARYANKIGFTMNPMRRRRTETEMLAEETDEVMHIEKVARIATYTNIHSILTNPFYIGKLLDCNGIYSIPSKSHQALVSEELFNKVQSMLNKKKVSVHYVQNLVYPYRGLVRCALCERSYTPYKKKGIQYYGVHCKGDCQNQNKNFNIDFLEEKIGLLLQKLSFTDNELIEIDARAHTDIALFEEKRFKNIETGERKKKKIREDLAYLRNNKLTLLRTGAYSPETYFTEEEKLKYELNEIKTEEDTSDVAMEAVIKDVVKLSELLKTLYPYYENALAYEKEELVRKIFSELSFDEDTLKYKCKNGFQALESRFVAMGELKTWLPELITYAKYITVSIQALEELINKVSKK
jgi:DNA invertase Pin-like site-specific DNA recombinase